MDTQGKDQGFEESNKDALELELVQAETESMKD